MRIKRLGVLALALTIAGGSMACTTPAPRRPVLLVHGFLLGPASWAPAVAQLEAQGYRAEDLVLVSYDDKVSVTQSASTLAAEVDAARARTGAAKVDIVSHSLGSLVTKQCIIFDACAGKVSHWMSISGVDNGTDVELIPPGIYVPSNEDVQGRTPVIRSLQDNWSTLVAQRVRVEVQWTPHDEIVQPPERSKEPAPAVNRQVDSLGHVAIISDPAVVAETARFFAS